MGSNQRQEMGTPHAYAAYSEWVALQNRLESASPNPVLVNGRDLSIADVVAVSM